MGSLSNDEFIEGEKIVCKEVILARRPRGWVTPDDIQVRPIRVDTQLGTGECLLQMLWVSVDPYLRTRMNGPDAPGLYLPSFKVGEAIESFAVAKVVASKDEMFTVGDFVVNLFPVQEYFKMVDGKGGFGYDTQKIDLKFGPLSYHLGVLGMTTFTAWVGLVLIGQPKSGEQVFVSAASGAVGIAAGQLAKSKGCRVVGSAGSDEKVKLLKEEFGFDDAFNYKAEKDWDAALSRLFPNGVDIYFDNVGGRMLQAVLNHINPYGRIPACGMISQYNKEVDELDGVTNLMTIVGRCVRMEGFLMGHHYDLLPNFLSDMGTLLKEGKFKYKEHVSEGIDNFASAFIGMLKGDNVGKAMVHVRNP